MFLTFSRFCGYFRILFDVHSFHFFFVFTFFWLRNTKTYKHFETRQRSLKIFGYHENHLFFVERVLYEFSTMKILTHSRADRRRSNFF